MSTRRGASKSKSATSSITSGGLSAYDPTKKKIAADAAPPNHPQENLPEHRTFLARSLSRNDEDMAALVDLNRTLHKVRQNMIDAFGEELLLDLGEGIFILTPCGRDIMVAPPENPDDFSQEKQVEREDRLAEIDDERKLLCVDFLLRMKLRRRLLNRLARRLMRVAHAMDGEDVSAPLPPKYGDLRLNIDQEDFEHAKRQWQLQEEARQRVDQFRREHPDSLVPLIKVEKKEEENNNSEVDDKSSSSNSQSEDDDEEEDSRDSKDGDDDEESEDDDKSKSDENKTEDDSKEESEEDSEEEDSEAETATESKPKDDPKVEDKSKSAVNKEGNQALEGTEKKDDTDKDAVADVDDVEMADAKDTSPNDMDPSKEAKEDKRNEGTTDVETGVANIKETEDAPKTAEDATKTNQEGEKDNSKDLDVCETENAQSDPVSSKASSDSDSDMFAADSADDKPNDETAALSSNKLVDDSNQHEGDKAVTKESEPMESSTKTDPNQDAAKDVESDGKANDIVKSPSKISTDAAEALLSMVTSSPEASPVKKEKKLDSPVDSQEQDVSSKIEEIISTKEDEKSQDSEASPTPEESTDRKTAAEEAPEVLVSKKHSEKLDDNIDVATKDTAAKENDEAKKSAMESDEKEETGDPGADDKNKPDTSGTDEHKMDYVDDDRPLTAKESDKSEQHDDNDEVMVETDSVDPDKAVKTELAPSVDEAVDTNETAGVGKGEEIQSSLIVKNDGEPTSSTEAKDDLGSIPGQTPKPDGTSSAKAQTAGNGAKCTPEKDASEAGTPKRKPLVELPPPRDLSQLEKDYEILKDFVDAYEKEINPITGKVTYRILKESDDHEEDYAKISRGVGIGASHRGGMSLKEKEVEFTRWQTALLGRIPEAPTFEEIGMKNCVFLLEERRKLLRMKLEQKKRKRSRSSGEYSDDEDYKPAPTKERNIGAVERKSPNKKGKDEEESEGTRVTKRMKPLPLVPYPSFYESDLRRIRLVHFDLMSTDIQNSAKDRLETATTEYNNAFQHSTKLFERKTKLEQQLSSLASHFRSHLSKIKQQYDVTVAVQKSRWQNQKAQYDANRIKKLMPTSWGTAPMGTELTSTVIQKYREGTIPHVVATCVADIVDAIEIKMTNSQVQDEPFEDFKPPPPPDFSTLVVDQSTGETMSQQIQRHQRNYQQELQTVTLKLNAAEEERKRAWKKLLKTKSEVEQIGNRGSQAPPLNSSSQAIPFNTSSRQQQMPSYTPGRRDSSGRGIESYAPSGGVNTSDSKYSAAKVRERIGTDGSVEPISKRIGTDGLYQRPAGRSRKGMDWDAQRGVWIPKSS